MTGVYEIGEGRHFDNGTVYCGLHDLSVLNGIDDISSLIHTRTCVN